MVRASGHGAPFTGRAETRAGAWLTMTIALVCVLWCAAPAHALDSRCESFRAYGTCYGTCMETKGEFSPINMTACSNACYALHCEGGARTRRKAAWQLHSEARRVAEAGDYERAHLLYINAFENGMDFGAGYASWASVLRHAQRPDLAADMLVTALALDRSLTDAYAQLADIYEAHPEHELDVAAIHMLHSALGSAGHARAPTDAPPAVPSFAARNELSRVLTQLAQLYARRNAFVDAAHAMAAALRFTPSNGDAWLHLARMSRLDGTRAADAAPHVLHAYTQALQRQREDTDTYCETVYYIHSAVPAERLPHDFAKHTQFCAIGCGELLSSDNGWTWACAKDRGADDLPMRGTCAAMVNLLLGHMPTLATAEANDAALALKVMPRLFRADRGVAPALVEGLKQRGWAQTHGATAWSLFLRSHGFEDYLAPTLAAGQAVSNIPGASVLTQPDTLCALAQLHNIRSVPACTTLRTKAQWAAWHAAEGAGERWYSGDSLVVRGDGTMPAAAATLFRFPSVVVVQERAWTAAVPVLMTSAAPLHVYIYRHEQGGHVRVANAPFTRNVDTLRRTHGIALHSDEHAHADERQADYFHVTARALHISTDELLARVHAAIGSVFAAADEHIGIRMDQLGRRERGWTAHDTFTASVLVDVDGTVWVTRVEQAFGDFEPRVLNDYLNLITAPKHATPFASRATLRASLPCVAADAPHHTLVHLGAWQTERNAPRGGWRLHTPGASHTSEASTAAWVAAQHCVLQT